MKSNLGIVSYEKIKEGRTGLREGDKIKVITSSNGSYGAEGKIGIITNEKSNHGLLDTSEGINIKIEEGNVWRVGEGSIFQIINKKIKIGDKVKMVVPYGKEFRAGSYYDTGFKGCITQLMVRFMDTNKIYEVSNAEGDSYITLKGDDHFWDKDWFERVDEEDVKPKIVKDKIELIYEGNTTKAIINEIEGVSHRGVNDKEDRKIGILIATMRALGFKRKTVDNVIDVLFDEYMPIKYLNNAELLDEVKKRMK